MSYIKDNFLLTNKTAEKLYFNYAKDMPIFDYHCHLSEKVILENKEFNDLIKILGCNVGQKFDLSKLQFNKIIIASDADKPEDVRFKLL